MRPRVQVAEIYLRASTIAVVVVKRLRVVAFREAIYLIVQSGSIIRVSYREDLDESRKSEFDKVRAKDRVIRLYEDIAIGLIGRVANYSPTARSLTTYSLSARSLAAAIGSYYSSTAY